ncbi:lipoprotein insertase outer membrane protein LolB [Methylosoma difficile]
MALIALSLSACAIFSPPQERPEEKVLYLLPEWQFSGRLAVSQKSDSWSASITWQHRPDDERIKLSGPLGQGAVKVHLDAVSVSIDRGDGKPQTSSDPQQFISEQLGLVVPIRALRYWVLGLPEPSVPSTKFGKGFNQLGWLVEFEQVQLFDGQVLPKKITVLNRQAKLKLIIDQWDLRHAGAN